MFGDNDFWKILFLYIVVFYYLLVRLFYIWVDRFWEVTNLTDQTAILSPMVSAWHSRSSHKSLKLEDVANWWKSYSIVTADHWWMDVISLGWYTGFVCIWVGRVPLSDWVSCIYHRLKFFMELYLYKSLQVSFLDWGVSWGSSPLCRKGYSWLSILFFGSTGFLPSFALSTGHHLLLSRSLNILNLLGTESTEHEHHTEDMHMTRWICEQTRLICIYHSKNLSQFHLLISITSLSPIWSWQSFSKFFVDVS